MLPVATAPDLPKLVKSPATLHITRSHYYSTNISQYLPHSNEMHCEDFLFALVLVFFFKKNIK